MDSKLKLPTNLVGRDEEIDLLQDLYRSLRDGTRFFDHRNSSQRGSQRSCETRLNRSVYVKGLSGTGKSALVRAALMGFVEEDGASFCQG